MAKGTIKKRIQPGSQMEPYRIGLDGGGNSLLFLSQNQAELVIQILTTCIILIMCIAIHLINIIYVY